MQDLDIYISNDPLLSKARAQAPSLAAVSFDQHNNAADLRTPPRILESFRYYRFPPVFTALGSRSSAAAM
jgi:hypothetical protein